MPDLILKGVTYHGGFSYIPESKWTRIGRMVLGDDAVNMDRIQDKQMRNLRPIELCRTRAIAAIEITSEQVAKSKIGAALVFGVLGGVTAKASHDRATVIVYLKSGEKGYFTIDGMSLPQLLGTLQPWMRERGIALGAPVSEAASPPAVADPAEQLKKLADLHQSGLLTDEEFAAKRATIVDKL